MSRTNTTHSYGSITRSFHWLIALLIIAMIPLGFYANTLAHEIEAGNAALIDQTRLLFSLHKTIGVALFFLALARIAWAITQPKPMPLHPHNRLETFAAETVHWLLYASLVLMPLTGWIEHAATTGFAPIWWPFGQSLPFVPQSPDVAETFASLHIIFARILILSVLLHIAGALKHTLIDRDGTLARMTRGTPAGAGTAPPKSHKPPLAALATFTAALAIGTSLGLFRTAEQTAPALATTNSDWTVTDGTIAIEITQFSAPVTGTFTDWTADITFDPDMTQGTAGHVTTTLSIPSLTLGSVTAQAMGPDFFDAQTHPTAVFQGEITVADGTYTATGTLTLKGSELPVTFPFALTSDDTSAEMSATLTLNRQDAGIGATTDTATLANAVAITLSLTATQTTAD